MGVTARNIFRYKKRMLMTIFGVCGAVTLLFAGLSVQHSIAGINDRQFSDILKYDLIIAENNSLDEKEISEIEDLLNGKDINKFTPVRYEEMNKVAGKKQDKQEIKMIVSQDTGSFGKFISLTDRKSGENIPLTSDGIVISERLSNLLDVKAGDTITTTTSIQEVMFNPALGAGAFIIPLILISVITICLGIVINNKLKKLNMLEALKSVE